MAKKLPSFAGLGQGVFGWIGSQMGCFHPCQPLRAPFSCRQSRTGLHGIWTLLGWRRVGESVRVVAEHGQAPTSTEAPRGRATAQGDLSAAGASPSDAERSSNRQCQQLSSIIIHHAMSFPVAGSFKGRMPFSWHTSTPMAHPFSLKTIMF